MAVIASGVATLIDVLKELAPDGSQLDTAEILTQENEVLADMTWMEGNLITGHRDSVRTALPTPSFRAINEGVPVTKGGTTPIEETCALLEDFSQSDRELAVLSGNMAAYRLRMARPHMIGMGHKMAQTVFYGNTGVDPKSFNGLAPRYNSLSGPTQQNIINAGGTGSALRSIWLVGWSEGSITGIFPKGSKGGLGHEDATSPSAGPGADGFPAGQAIQDANGNLYMGFRDHWLWRCGMMVKDWRFAVRICNIDPAALTFNQASGANIQNLMIRALETIQGLTGVRAAFYMPRTIRSYLRQQMVEKKNQFMSYEDMGGKQVMMFGEVPVRRTDALNVNELQVV